MKAVHLLPDASRKSGGLFSAVSSLCRALTDHGWDIDVFASVKGFNDEDRDAWTGSQLRLYPSFGPSSFSYLTQAASNLSECSADVVHAHGLWTYVSVLSSRARRLGFPTVLSPHGMLDPWALSNSRWKKRIAMLLFEKRNLHATHCIHALCDSEASSVRSIGFRGYIAVIPNGVFLPNSHLGFQKRGEYSSKTVVFLSRLHPKKGLSELLQGWASFSRSRPRLQTDWRLRIIGWGDVAYNASLKRLATELGIDSKVDFDGPLFGRDKDTALAGAHAFILPSLSEGLPMSVLEAWSHSLPVIMTDHCNLPCGFSERAALRCETNAKAICHALHELASMSEFSVRQMGENGRKLVETQFTWERVASSMGDVYMWLGGKREKPVFVQSFQS